MNEVTRIGRYRVDAQIGAGGFAQVWRGFDEGLDDEVAIKVLFEHLSRDKALAEQFLEEARILRKLASDKIVRVYDVDTLEAGQPFFVMEHAALGTLEDRMVARSAAGQPYSVVDALAVAADLAECLTVVHDFNVVHRDIKPSNVLYTSIPVHQQKDEIRRGLSPRSERMVLGDFGIAHRLDLAQTRGLLVGTPMYMAPEMADFSRTTPVDRRADVYCAAVVLYELLTGRTPFTPAWNGAFYVPVNDGHPPSLRLSRPDVPPGLETAVERALSVDPEDRFSTAWEWGEVLHHWLLELRDDHRRPGTIVARVTPSTQSAGREESVLLHNLVDVCDRALDVTPAHLHALATRLRLTRARLTGPLRIVVAAESADQASTVAVSLGPIGLRHARTDRLGEGSRRPDEPVAVVGCAVPDSPSDVTDDQRRELLAAHAFVVVLPDDVMRGRALLRSLRRLVRDRMGLVNCVGLAVREGGIDHAYRSDPQLRPLLARVLVAPSATAGHLDGVTREVEGLFVDRSEVLRAMGGFRDLGNDLTSASLPGMDHLADELERLRIEAHELDELDVLAQESAGLLGLPETLADDLRRVLGERSLLARVGLPPDARLELVQGAAARGSSRWRSFVNGGRGSDRAERAAHVVALSYERLWTAAVESDGKGP
ncbi:MAG: eukaryotic-like serine/threonine-protein kinase [Acidimicrobiaceae bacterium]